MKTARLQPLLLMAIIVVAALLPAVAAAEKTTKTYSVQSTGFIETAASSKQTFKLGELEASCESVIVKSAKEYTIGNYSKIVVHPEYPKCIGTLAGIKAAATVSTTGCGYELSPPVGEFNLWTANFSLVNLEKATCEFAVKSLCEVKAPTELNKELPFMTIVNINEVQGDSKKDKSVVSPANKNLRTVNTGCGGSEKGLEGKYTGQVEVERAIVNTK
jgi:hypothetical protein